MRRILLGGGTIAGLSAAAYGNRGKLRRAFVEYFEEARKLTAWEDMPERIILLRHGQSEANVNHHVLASKPDNLIELTNKGREQATAAGEKIKALLPKGSHMQVILSPFERTQQTLCCVVQALGSHIVSTTLIDPRVREQEFGNLQESDDVIQHSKLARQVGRFYYRRPDGESSADVFDRASDVWRSLVNYTESSLSFTRHFERGSKTGSKIDTVLVVTHGLTSTETGGRTYDRCACRGQLACRAACLPLQCSLRLLRSASASGFASPRAH